MPGWEGALGEGAGISPAGVVGRGVHMGAPVLRWASGPGLTAQHGKMTMAKPGVAL